MVPVLEGTSEDVLAKGFGHFEDTADPGDVGQLRARRPPGHPRRAAAADARAAPGDRVIVETVAATYTYELDTDPNELIIPFTGVWVLDPLPKNPEAGGAQPAQRPGQRLLTLTTCSELFHTDNRMIAFGHLVKVDGKDA